MIIINKDIKVEVGDRTFFSEYAVIKSTMLGLEDHDIMTFFLMFEHLGGGGGQGFGGYSFACYNRVTKKQDPTLFGMAVIMEILRVSGARDWESLKGIQLLILREERSGPIVGFVNENTRECLLMPDLAAVYFDHIDDSL